MIILTCINEKLERVDIISMKGSTAVDFARRIVHIPHKYRYVRIIAVKSTTKYDEITYEDYIHSVIARMIPTLEQFHKFAQFPITFHYKDS